MAPELKCLMQSAAHEIRDLRRQRDLLQAKVDGFEMASQFLNAQIRSQTQGMSIDVAWELDKACEESRAWL
jgi:hypothetical protein